MSTRQRICGALLLLALLALPCRAATRETSCHTMAAGTFGVAMIGPTRCAVPLRAVAKDVPAASHPSFRPERSGEPEPRHGGNARLATDSTPTRPPWIPASAGMTDIGFRPFPPAVPPGFPPPRE